MIKKNFKDVSEEVVTKANSTKTTVRWLITKEDGTKGYATRMFEIQPGGQIGLHSHPEDHHLFVLQGDCQALKENDEKIALKAGDVIYVPPNELHGFENNGNDIFTFLCIIPYL